MPTLLSDLERKILDYMVHYLRTNTYQPSIREIGEKFEIKSTKTVSEHLRALADKGYLERDPSRSRGVRILGVDLAAQTVSVPCYGAFPDDRSGFKSDGVEAYYSLDRRMAGAKGSYFVRARDEGLAPLGVEPGDFLLVEPASAGAARDGDLVVARMSGAPELYEYRRRGSTHQLRPSRNGDTPIELGDAEDLDITGRVVGLFRSFEQTAVPVSATTH